MMGNRKRMRSRQSVRMLPPDHQRRLVAVEPAGILELGAIYDNVLIGGARGASDHQRRRIGPGLRHVIIHVSAADSGLLENLAPDRVFDGFGGFDEPRQTRPHPWRKLLLPS